MPSKKVAAFVFWSSCRSFRGSEILSNKLLHGECNGESFREDSSLPSTFYRCMHLDKLKRKKLSSWGYKMEENWNGKWNKSFCFDLWVITAEANLSAQNAPSVYVARMFCHQNLGGVNWNLPCGFCGTLICFLNLIYSKAEGLQNSWR